jgi:hypothetical protein
MSGVNTCRHAALDYGVAGAFFAVALSLLGRHRAASTLAFINGGMIVGMSMLTDYPGGVFRKLSFKAHRTGDIVQAALAGSARRCSGSRAIPKRAISTDRRSARSA